MKKTLQPKTKTFTLSEDARRLLASMDCQCHSGYVCSMKPPTERASAKVYAEAKKALILMGGDWRSGPGAFFFKDNGLLLADMVHAIETGEVRNTRQSEQSFFTPPALACQVAYLVNEAIGKRFRPNILEPSCGDGALVGALANHFFGQSIVAIDIESKYAQHVNSHYPRVKAFTGNFGDCKPGNLPGIETILFDAVVMNPPFDGKLWQQHILHALDFIPKKGTVDKGIIVAIVPRSATLDFLPDEVRSNATLTPVKADFQHTPTKVSILTINVPRRVVSSALRPIVDADAVAVAEDQEPLKSPEFYLAEIKRLNKEVEKTLGDLERELRSCRTKQG